MAISEDSIEKMLSFVEALVRKADITVQEALINEKKVETKVSGYILCEFF